MLGKHSCQLSYTLSLRQFVLQSQALLKKKKALKSEYAWEKRVKLQNAYIACIKPWMQSATKKGRWGGRGGGREGEGGRREGQNEGVSG